MQPAAGATFGTTRCAMTRSMLIGASCHPAPSLSGRTGKSVLLSAQTSRRFRFETRRLIWWSMIRRTLSGITHLNHFCGPNTASSHRQHGTPCCGMDGVNVGGCCDLAARSISNGLRAAARSKMSSPCSRRNRFSRTSSASRGPFLSKTARHNH